MKKNRKKRLPKYWLGTRMPASLGYQPNQGAGNVSYSTAKGEDFTPEANAASANILPSAFNKATQSIIPTIQNIATNSVPVLTAASSKALGKYLANSFTEQLGSQVWKGGELVSEGSITSAAPKLNYTNALSTAGKVLSGVGAAYGLANMGMDFAHNQDHRSVADMWDTVNTSTYTTDKGNTYNTYSGPNLQAELDYASSQKTSRNLNNTINAAGTGAAIGSAIAPGIGTLIGGLGGALYGGLSALFGFGDTYEDVMNEYRKTQDVAALKSLQSEASAKNKDVRQGFYERSNDGRVAAAGGKKPVYGRGGKINAKVSNGEWIGNLKEGWVQQVPGEPNNKDTENANLRSSDYVISNPFVPLAAATGDIKGTLILQDMYNRNKQNFKQAPMKAKCGKMPKYSVGRWGDYALSTLPHLGSVLTNLYQYNRVKNAEEYAPTITTEAPAAQNAINQMMAERIDPRQYLNRSLLNYNQAAWNARRTPGMGLGGRMVMLDSLARAKQASDADTLMKIDEANRAQRNKGYEARINLDKYLSEMNTKNAWNQYAYRQQAHGQKETWLAQYLKNMDQGLINAASDALRTSQYHQAMANQQRELDIWQQQVNNDKMRILRELGNQDDSSTTNSTSAPIYKFDAKLQPIRSGYGNTPLSNILAQQMWSQYKLQTPMFQNMPGVVRRYIPSTIK